MSDIANLRDTIIPKSDQLNAEQLLAGPMTITITDVRRGATDDQPVILDYEGDAGRPYKPCKSMRKVLIFAWGEDGRQWIGRSMTLYNDPSVKFGGVAVGGIRISHMSHIDRDISLSLTATKGKKEPRIIKRLEVTDPLAGARKALHEAAEQGTAALQAAWGKLDKATQRKLGGCPAELKDRAAEVDQTAQHAEAPAPAKDGGTF